MATASAAGARPRRGTPSRVRVTELYDWSTAKDKVSTLAKMCGSEKQGSRFLGGGDSESRKTWTRPPFWKWKNVEDGGRLEVWPWDFRGELARQEGKYQQEELDNVLSDT